MRIKIIFVVLLLCGSAWAYPGWNTNFGTSAGSAVSSLTTNLAYVNSSHIIVYAAKYCQTSTATISDTFSDSVTRWLHASFASDGGCASFFDLGCIYTSSNTGSDTVTLSNSLAVNSVILVAEETDGTFPSCAAAFDNGGTGSGVGSTTGSGTTTGTSSAASSTVTGDTIFGGCASSGSPTPNAGSGFITNPFGNTPNIRWEYNTAGGAGSQTASCAVQNNWIVVMVLIKPATAANGVYIRNFTANQNMASGTGGAINLPTGMNSGDYCICAAASETRPNYATQGFSALAGWTTLFANGGQGAWAQFWTSGTATPTVTAQQNNGFYEGMCAAYGGVNATTPTDMINDFWLGIAPAGAMGNLPTPPVFPAWTTDMLVAFNFETTNGSDQPVVPTGMNNRYVPASGGGPFIAGADVNLTSSSPTTITSYVWTQSSAGNNGRHSLGILLMPASGGASATRQLQPTEEAISIFVGGGNASTGTLYPVVGDLIVAQFFGTGGVCNSIASGYSAVYNTNDMLVATHTWLNTDTTGSLGTFGCPGGQSNTYVIHNAVNPATSPQVFAGCVGAACTATHSSTTSDASPSIATITNSLLLVQYSAGNSGTAINGSFTMPGGLFADGKWTASSQITTGSGSLQAPSNPTGAFTATNSVSGTQNSGAVIFCIPGNCSAGGVPRHKTVIF